jgi:nicotinate dehydrogenase subunit B
MNRPTGALPQFIVENSRLGDWFAFAAPGRLTLKTGKVEIGQDILTALRQIAAEELELPLSVVDVLSGDTRLSPNEGPTVASLSIMMSGPAVRAAAIEMRGRLFGAAATRLGVAASQLSAIDGIFHVAGTTTEMDYWMVAADVDLDERISGQFLGKDPAAYRLVGTSPVSPDLIKKLSGPAYIHDFSPEGLLHGRALRQPHLGAKLVRFDSDRARTLEGVILLVHDGNFIGLVAESEHLLFAAMDRLERLVEWHVDESENALSPLDYLDRAHSVPVAVHEDFQGRHRNWQYAATFTKPLIGHGSIGPSCAIACFDDGTLRVWTHSQNVYALRTQISRVIGIPEPQVLVRHLPAAGCYGHNGADDVAMDAVLLARAVPGRPVRAQWSRRDELRAEPLSSPMRVAVSASLEDGRVAAWCLTTRSGTHVRRPGWGDEVNLLAAAALRSRPWPFHEPTDVPLDLGGGGGAKNSVAGYDFPQRVVYEFVPDLPFRVSSMRSLGAFANVLAIESSMDELASLAGRDPVEFRLAHLTNPRSRRVIETVVAMSDWYGTIESGQAKGLGFAQFENEVSYCAVVAQVSVDADVKLLRMWGAVDAGLAINPGGIVAQVEGGMIQAASWTLREAVPTEGRRVVSESWKDYPILRFSDIPDISVSVISDSTDPSLGVGEVAMGPTAGAIANAVARSLGIRVRDLPITRDRIISVLMADDRT